MKLWVKADMNSKFSAIATMLNTGSVVEGKYYYVVEQHRNNASLIIYFVDERGKITCADAEGFIAITCAENTNPNLDVPKNDIVPAADPVHDTAVNTAAVEEEVSTNNNRGKKRGNTTV